MSMWKNWAGDQICAPAAIERPASEAELSDIVVRAAGRGQRVRAVGSGHSFTDCACTDGVMIDMTGLQRVINVDKANGLATVQGGAKLHPLFAELAASGFGIENQGDIDKQSITGATATATHGTGARFKNVSAQIVSARVVTATGEVLEVSEGDDYLAARVSLGALGVISQVTLKVVPLFTLHREDELRPLTETLDRLDADVDGNDHFEFFVFPYGDTALTRTTRRSNESPRPAPAWKKKLGEGFENVGLNVICRAGRQFPSAAPRLNRLLTSLMSPSSVQDHGWKVYASARNVKFTEMEYAIPREHARVAVQRVIDLVRRRNLPIMYPLEVRFSAPDDAFLSTANGRDTCYIAVHQFSGMEFETYFRAVEEIMDEYEGRPHWGKRHYQTAATLRERYPDWDRFIAVRDRLDPERVFRNDYTRRVLGN
ncbi:L-gulono-1,4-lactone dehydrogenase [Mycobacterium paragordonae]|uniref:L-gulono-1,4-lactone dehydrogenase n=2 Tax=Mycobacterium paragordonae TaxID=1389713 RepID=A0ABQ1C4S1_9MYCO|nr:MULTISPECIES: D-arabinono-1,4-lactone oxidase [Mycobacterium]GFG79291.1 L-gulono-1,4-lactone dehydrogenase [Mycobacterium paragordonae]